TLGKGSCSTAFTVTSQDADGNASNVSGDTTVNLTQNGNGAFEDNSACGHMTTTTVIANGTSTATFYYKDLVLENNIPLTAAYSGLTSGNINLSVTGGSDTWASTSTGTGVPSARYYHAVVWTGSKMIVFGGTINSSDFNDGALYDPSADSWSPI